MQNHRCPKQEMDDSEEITAEEPVRRTRSRRALRSKAQTPQKPGARRTENKMVLVGVEVSDEEVKHNHKDESSTAPEVAKSDLDNSDNAVRATVIEDAIISRSSKLDNFNKGGQFVDDSNSTPIDCNTFKGVAVSESSITKIPTLAVLGTAGGSNMAPTISNIYQFKITLKGSKRKIWRRIQVPEKYNFWDLHVAIQDAMGWQDCHLHQFQMINPKTRQKVVIGIPDEDGWGFIDTIPEKTCKIAKYFLYSQNKASYEYDFGDGWEHEVLLEKILPATAGTQYPQCIAGKLACPPEDCGGVWGYEHLLEIMADPQHEEYEERMEWLGGSFNPVDFDPKLVMFENSKERFKLAFN